MANGQEAICANKLNICMDPNGVGSMLRTKINVNPGISRDWNESSAEAIMDLSFHGSIFQGICFPRKIRPL